MEKVKVIIKDAQYMLECPDGQLRDGKGNKNDECWLSKETAAVLLRQYLYYGYKNY